MKIVKGGWGRFRRLPPIAQALIGLVLVTAYSIALIGLVGNGGDEGKPKPRPLTAQERRVAKIVGDAGIRQLDITDVNDFRRARVRTVKCTGDLCEIVYAVGVPGGGRLRVQQIDMLQPLYREQGLRRVKLIAYRDTTVGAQRPLKPEEETGGGALLAETTCDAGRRPDVDWSTRTGGSIFSAICKFKGGAGRLPGAGPPACKGNAGAGE